MCVKEESKSYTSRKHTAGLFVGCCPHEIAYGFSEMVESEGRKHLLKVAVERFPQEVLDQLHIVYDFSCQEAEYMMNRLPQLFKHTRLFLDRFHAKSHKCASMFKLQSYPIFQEVITTASETLNSFVQLFHSSAPYMSQATHVSFVRLVFGLRNYKTNQDLMRLLEQYNIKTPDQIADPQAAEAKESN